MARKPKTIPGPSRLSKILANLRRDPVPQLLKVRSLQLTLASRNDHFGARHFLKEELPRIRYANPEVDIQVNRVPKSPQDTWKSELTLEFEDGTKRTLHTDQKWSSVIFQELMDTAGGTPWQKWKQQRAAEGLPVVDIPEPRSKPQTTEEVFRPNPLKTGAAAVLP